MERLSLEMKVLMCYNFSSSNLRIHPVENSPQRGSNCLSPAQFESHGIGHAWHRIAGPVFVMGIRQVFDVGEEKGMSREGFRKAQADGCIEDVEPVHPDRGFRESGIEHFL